jgi:hypothetical protein
MDTTTDVEKRPGARKRWRKSRRSQQGGPGAGGGAVYGLGMIGALVYFFGSAASGRDYVMAFPKAMLWPAVLVYKLLKSLES